MPKIKTSELSGAALDWAVAKARKEKVVLKPWLHLPNAKTNRDGPDSWKPSVFWRQGGPLIHWEGVWLSDDNETEENWIASAGGVNMQYGLTPLIAACRAIVSAHLGDEVDIPEELV